jgi:hypothetical protein
VSAGAAASFPALLFACVAAVLAAFSLAGGARASIIVATNAQSPALKVDAKGYAEVSWTAGGARHYVLVTPDGKTQANGRVLDADASEPSTAVSLPYLKVLRETPDGKLWALQEWQVNPGGPIELHLARWSGDPTQLTLSFDVNRIVGTAMLDGKPVHGLSVAPGGVHPRIYVLLDCSGCPLATAGWGRMLSVPPRPDGSFRVYVQTKWTGKTYRASLVGPNAGTTLAPDAVVTVNAPA